MTTTHSSPSDSPTLDPTQWGPCGKPCDHPCDEPCDETAADGATAPPSRWFRWLQASLFNTLDLCFDDVYREPRKILIVGGSRQMVLSQHIALLLPAAEIFLVDPDEAVTQRAQEEICCRFKFVTAPLEVLPFEADAFDLTIANHFFNYPDHWQTALSELGRVTQGNLFLSTARPILWSLASRLPGFKEANAQMGIEPPKPIPDSVEMLTHLLFYTKIKTKLAPFPWSVLMTQMRPLREERLVLPTAP